LEADCSADARLVAATIAAVAQGTFSNTVNATDLIFYTGHSETAAERFRFTSQNEIGVAGANYGTDGQVLTSGGAGAAVAWEDAGGGVVSGGTDNAILRADGTGGSTSQGSCVIISDAGAIGAANGTACLPSLSFKCDTDTGHFLVSAGNIGTAISGSEVMRVNSNGALFIGETVESTTGAGAIVSNSGAVDAPHFILKSSDVAHGGTQWSETDTYFTMEKACANNGGIKFESFSEATTGVYWNNWVNGGWTTQATNQGGSWQFIVYHHDGANALSTMDANTNLFTIGFSDACTTARRFHFDKEGTAHADVGVATYDDYCDVELLRGMLATTCDQYKQNYVDKFGEDLMYNKQWYEDNRLIGKCSIHYETRPCGRVEQRAMVNFTNLTMLHHSTIIQMADRFSARIDGLETQLKALQGGCP